jgi:hypothetical protein
MERRYGEGVTTRGWERRVIHSGWSDQESFGKTCNVAIPLPSSLSPNPSVPALLPPGLARTICLGEPHV